MAAVTAGAAACGTDTTSPATANTPGPSDGSTAADRDTAPEHAALEHVHAVQFANTTRGETAASTILVATHAGLYTLQVPPATAGSATGAAPAASLRRVGPPVDLMGFTVAQDGTYLASGHPAPSTGLPEPLGLAATTDGGRTWQVLSRGGESDFHTLSVSRRGVIAYDGALRFSADRRQWQDRPMPSPPRMLAAQWDTGHVLATTESGLLHSTDDARTWSTLRPPGLLSDVAWAGSDTIVGISTTQVLVLSTDAGRTWRTGPGPIGPPPGVAGLGPVAAMTARAADPATSRSTSTSAGSATLPEVVLAFGSVLVRTSDLGASSQRLT